MEIENIAQIFTSMLALIIGLTLHEAGHAFAAKHQGDRTAEFEGRLTLNPIPHIDVLGTLILPVLMALGGSPIIFGWAKPVPVNTRNLRHGKTSYMLVAAAGPFMNLILALVSVGAWVAIRIGFADNLVPGSIPDSFQSLFYASAATNAVLAFFNLIPIPPLDGGTILTGFLSDKWNRMYDEFIVPYGSWILLALIMTGSLRIIQIAAIGYVKACLYLFTILT